MQTQTAVQAQTANIDNVPFWSHTKRIAFRFCCVYFSLYILVTQMLATLILIPWIDWPELGSLPPIQPMVSWVAKHHCIQEYPFNR